METIKDLDINTIPTNYFFVKFKDKEIKSSLVKTTTLPGQESDRIIKMVLYNSELNKEGVTTFEKLINWMSTAHDDPRTYKQDIDICLLSIHNSMQTSTKFSLHGCKPCSVNILEKLDYTKCEPTSVSVSFCFDNYNISFPKEIDTENFKNGYNCC